MGHLSAGDQGFARCKNKAEMINLFGEGAPLWILDWNGEIEGGKVYKAIIKGEATAMLIMAKFVHASAPVSMQPLPDDEWLFATKEEHLSHIVPPHL